MSALRHAVRAWPTLLRIGVAEMVAYRAEIFIWFLTATMPLIMMLVWDRVAAGGPVGRFDQPGFARYFVATLVVRQLTSSWLVWEMNEQIRSGSLSPALLKPMHPLVLPAAENIAALPFRAAMLLPLVAVIWLWRPEMRWGVAAADLPLLVVAVFLAWLLNYLTQVCFAALAFWLQQSSGLFMVWFGVWVLLSGYAFPLELMPPALLAAVRWLPFRAMLGVPVEIASGLSSGLGALAAVALQLVWCAAVGLLARAMWRAGVRRYEAYGA
ncbi:MAG TPA: ABC-2 family transporter protein [Myxococcota bacterium]|jgi:ABC-2 type transport system permease protein|nr:ABC-2 family transporter protein [Myxococcota bacterium]